jgi:hypothetical protein
MEKKGFKNTGVEHWWKETGCGNERSRRNLGRSKVPSTPKFTRTAMGSNRTSVVETED